MSDLSLTRDRMVSALQKMKWSTARPHEVKGKTLFLRTAYPNNEFWEAHRGLVQEWFSVGITVTKVRKRWTVKWWSDEQGSFTLAVPRLRKV